MRETPMDSLDDVVYHLKSGMAAVELLSALFVMRAGLGESWTAGAGNWSFVNIVIIILHFYFNILLRIINGWQSFRARQAAVNRIQSLKDATDEQLEAFNDVCAICYGDMAPQSDAAASYHDALRNDASSSSECKVTPCGHFFHARCLKKWLLTSAGSNQCPMCQTNVIEEPPEQRDEAADAEDEEQGVEDVNDDAVQEGDRDNDVIGNGVIGEENNDVIGEENNDVIGEEVVN